MDLYQRKIFANKLIVKLVGEGKSDAFIYQQIESSFGLSEKYCDKVIERLRVIADE